MPILFSNLVSVDMFIKGCEFNDNRYTVLYLMPTIKKCFFFFFFLQFKNQGRRWILV